MRRRLVEDLLKGRFLRLRACTGHHLHEHLLCILEPFEEGRILKFKVVIGNWHSFELTLSIDEGHDATATAENEFRLVLKHDLNDFVATTKQDSLSRTLPFLDVGKREFLLLSDWCIFLRERELERLKLLVTVKVALEVLEQDNFFINSLWELEKVVLADHLLVVSSSLRSSLTINVVKMEEVWVGDDLSRVIEKNTIRSVA